MPGEPSHVELGVPDGKRAKAFYARLLGWEFETTTGENAWIDTGGAHGGLHDGDEARNIVVYFRVDDIEAAVERSASWVARRETRNRKGPAVASSPVATTRASSSACTSPPAPDGRDRGRRPRCEREPSPSTPGSDPGVRNGRVHLRRRVLRTAEFRRVHGWRPAKSAVAPKRHDAGSDPGVHDGHGRFRRRTRRDGTAAALR